MDSRIYFHQYRRPRHSNPTYLSSNVQNSISFFHGDHNPDYMTRKEAMPRYRFQSKLNERQTNTPVNSYFDTIQKPNPQQINENQLRQTNSKLSKYGERSLNLDQKGVYHKQVSPYNIISLKPKEFSDEIKKYPWYSIENRDDVYFKRMQQAYKEKASYSARAKTYEKPIVMEIAGKHTYDLQPKISINPQRMPGKQRFTPKMLNHMDQLQHSLA